MLAAVVKFIGYKSGAVDNPIAITWVLRIEHLCLPEIHILKY
jgi:hypothetical protein